MWVNVGEASLDLLSLSNILSARYKGAEAGCCEGHMDLVVLGMYCFEETDEERFEGGAPPGGHYHTGSMPMVTTGV